MQMMKNFGETLKGLKDICGIKSITLANYLGYDISYISKWCADKKLPSGRNSTNIIDKLALIFSREIVNAGELEVFNKSYGTDIKKRDELYEYIRTILEDSYDRSKKKEKTSKNRNSKIIFGSRELSSYVRNKIYEISKRGEKELFIYSTLDILTFDIGYIDESFPKSDFSKIYFKVGCDMQKFEYNNYLSIYNLHHILSSLNFCDIQVYDNKEFNKGNVFLVKDEFAIICSFNKEDRPEFGVVISNEEELEKIYNSIKYKFTAVNNIVDAVCEEELLNNRYILNFYNSQKFNFLFNLDFDFLNPELIMEHEEFKKVQGIIDKKLMSSEMNIFLEKQMINDFIYGCIIKSDEERLKGIRERVERIISFMESNDKIKVYMIKNRKEDFLFTNDDLSVYHGEHYLFLKKEEDFYIVKNHEMLNNVSRLCQELKDDKDTEELDFIKMRNALEELGNIV